MAGSAGRVAPRAFTRRGAFAMVAVTCAAVAGCGPCVGAEREDQRARGRDGTDTREASKSRYYLDIYYMAFDWETPVGIGAGDMRREADFRLLVRVGGETERALMNYLRDLRPGGVSPGAVRMLISRAGHEDIEVDYDGGVVWGTQEFQLAPGVLQQLGDFMDRVAAAHRGDVHWERVPGRARPMPVILVDN